MPLSGVEGRTGLRVLIADDEEFNRLRMKDLLAMEDDAVVVGEAATGDEAVELIRSLHPDLVFLDIRMPGRSGLEVARAVGADAMPATIFVTAYDHYAVEAFDVAAIDYLIKPFDDERFAQALNRARRLLALEGLADMRARLLRVLDVPVFHGSSASEPAAADRRVAGDPSLPENIPASDSAATPHADETGATHWERIPVEERGTIRPIAVSDIDYILASGPYAELVVGGSRHLVRETMQTLEERLDPSRFMRIHRSVIVRLDRVEGLKRGAGGDGEVLLKGGGRLRVSRTRRESLEKWLGIA